MNTTYDTLWNKFESITMVDDWVLPSTLESRIALIHNGVDIYNQKAYDSLGYNDTLETLDRELDSNRILIIAHAMKLQVTLNMLSDFTSTYSMFQTDIGIRDYKSQVSARRSLVGIQENKINELIFAICEDIGGDE